MVNGVSAAKVFITHSHTCTCTHIQGLMYGYATDETEELMPLTIMLAHKMNKQIADYRRDGTLPWLRPDSKTQVKIKS